MTGETNESAPTEGPLSAAADPPIAPAAQVVPRVIPMHTVLRYPAVPSRIEEELDGLPNFHYMTAGPPSTGLEILQLSRGIRATLKVDSPSGPRRGVLAIRSTPWNAGGEFNPWPDEFDLDYGHVRYFGDHRVDTIGFPGATLGNRMLMEAWALHSATSRDERVAAPPTLIFQSCAVVRSGRREVKGQVEFCGVGLIERLEHVVQRDPKTGRSFPNIVIDLAEVDLAAEGDSLDMRWIDARRNPSMTAEEALSFAPQAGSAGFRRDGRPYLACLEGRRPPG